MRKAIMWFRRDLRLTDNPALLAAAAADAMLPVFILDERLLSGPHAAPARLVYLRHALADLAAGLSALGSGLRVLRGDPAAVLADLVDALAGDDAEEIALHLNVDHTPFSSARDAAVADALDGTAVVERHDGVTIAPPGSVLTGSGSPYKVFTPYSRTWLDTPHGDPQEAPDALPPLPSPGGALPPGLAVSDVDELQPADTPSEPWPDGGETAARERLDAWLAEPVDDYDDRRNALAVDGTSRLSADLRLGCLSAREVFSRLDRRNPGQDAFARQLIWRDFYLQVMAAWPHSATGDLKPIGGEWRDDPDGLAAWKEGRTGYPVVDAGMRQLTATGWMHNRARMIVASFLTKDLLIDWRAGAAHFMAHLVDGDPSNNTGGWQWAAGTGTDAQPFFRIFNPVTQGERFDPDGEYIRRWVPELASLGKPAIHKPWTMSASEQEEAGVVIGRDYPAPIVDHADARERALDWYHDARS